MKLYILPGCAFLFDSSNFQKYLENGCSTTFCCLFLCTWPLTALKHLAFHPPGPQVLRIYIHFHIYIYIYVFINSRKITLCSLQLSCQKIAFCLHGRETMSWPFCHHCSLPLGAHWCLMCWKPYGLLSLLFLLLLPWKLQVEKDQLLTPRTNRDFIQEGNNDGERPSAVPQLPPKTFSFQLPPVLRFSVIRICSFLLVWCFFFFFCTSLSM